MIDLCPTPESYAARLARYISDPSTIRVRTLQQWGRAPSLERCRALREKHIAPKRDKEIMRIHEGNFKCGHSRKESNTYWTESGTQTCKQCRREAYRRAKQRQRESERLQFEMETLSREAAEEIVKARSKELEEAAETSALNGIFADELMGMVCRLFDIAYADLIGTKRSRRFVIARIVVVKLLLERGYSRKRIAHRMNRKCHSSIIHLEGLYDEYSKIYPLMANVYEALR